MFSAVRPVRSAVEWSLRAIPVRHVRTKRADARDFNKRLADPARQLGLFRNDADEAGVPVPAVESIISDLKSSDPTQRHVLSSPPPNSLNGNQLYSLQILDTSATQNVEAFSEENLLALRSNLENDLATWADESGNDKIQEGLLASAEHVMHVHVR